MINVVTVSEDVFAKINRLAVECGPHRSGCVIYVSRDDWQRLGREMAASQTIVAAPPNPDGSPGRIEFINPGDMGRVMVYTSIGVVEVRSLGEVAE